MADKVEVVTPSTTSVSGVANVREHDEEEEEKISIDDLDDSGEDKEEVLIDTPAKGEEEEKISIDDLDDKGGEEVVVDKPVEKPTAVENPIVIEEPATSANEPEILRAKLQKSLADLEDIRSEMKTSFTSTDTISTTINAVKGMLDALKKDQMAMQNSME